jgi:ABC-type nickel/cobalt efflux system permease component RcnA
MTYAMARGVPEAGLTFAAAMMIGVAATLTVVALAAISFRRSLMALLDGRAAQFAIVSRLLEGSAGSLLVWIGVHEVFLR